MQQTSIKNIAFYKFFTPKENWQLLRAPIREQMVALEIRGTLLLSEEGMNASIIGTPENLDAFVTYLLPTLGIDQLVIKASDSPNTSFAKSLVKIKKHIVADPGPTQVDLSTDQAPYLAPETLHEWIQNGKEMIVLDTRNDYEYEVGKFKGSLHLGTKHFADFESDLEKTPERWKQMPVVTFCTGGIRCEKAAPLMIKKGFREVYQLEGGILNYFEKVGRGFFEGGCFVFDHRVALSENLKPTGEVMCFGCQAVLSMEEQKLPQYQPPRQCHHCAS